MSNNTGDFIINNNDYEYRGQVVAGIPHGSGKFVYKNGDTYEG